MSRAGVICEFNPFHNGHKFLFEKIKRKYANEIVCIMSGNFVQRGDIAIADKYARTKSALQNGADIVVELPTPYALSSARIFAENGVRLAAAMNCDTLCFGAESDLKELTELSDLLNDTAVNEKIQAYMKDGMYYPKALSLAVGENYTEIISQPNNILALEYIRACKAYDIEPIAIERKGVNHDEEAACDSYASASLIRRMILNNEDYSRYTPMAVENPCTSDKIESVILYRLKTIEADELREIADVSEGLENRIINAAKRYNSITEILEAVKTKRYTMARLRRIFFATMLNITAETQNTPVPYLRILGLKNSKESLLSNAKLPPIIKTKANYDKLDNSSKEIFNVDIRATEAMNIASGQRINEFSQPIVKI